MPSSPADWQLPPGVNRGLWDYLHNQALARGYDAGIASSSLCEADLAFAERFFPRPGPLIDLGCGTGRLLLPFAQRGFSAVGVDLSEAMLQFAGEKARSQKVEVGRIKANLVDLDGINDQSFDYAACLFSTLGMVLGAENRRRVVAHAFRLLRPEGVFVVHVHNRWFNVWSAPGRRWLCQQALRALRGGGDLGDCLMPVHQGVAGLTLHLFTEREAVLLLRGAGFQILDVQPVGLGQHGRLSHPGWLGRLRAYGYLLAARRPRC